MTSRNIRIRKDDSWTENAWTAVPNSLIRDAKISWDARMAFAWLASHSMNFTLAADDLAAAGPKGRNHARDMLRELEKHGWLTRHKEHNPKTGRYDSHVYHLHPVQVPESDRTFTESTAKRPRSSFQQNASSDPAPVRSGAGRTGPERTGAEREGVSRARLSLPLEEHLLTEGEEHTTAREAVPVEASSLFPIDGPSGLAPDEAAAEWDAKQRRKSRSTQAMERLNATRYRPAAVPIVARFEQRTHRLSRTEKGKWWTAVSNLLDLEYPDEIIDAALDQCIADGVGYGLLESKALLVANRPKFAAQSKLATSDRRSNEIDALFDQRAAAGYGSAAQVIRPEIEAPR